MTRDEYFEAYTEEEQITKDFEMAIEELKERYENADFVDKIEILMSLEKSNQDWYFRNC